MDPIDEPMSTVSANNESRPDLPLMARNYFKTSSGITRSSLLVLDLAALICILVQFNHYERASQYFMFVTISSFLVNGLIMFLTLCHVTQIYPRTPLIEMGADALWILFYLIGASLLLSQSSSLLSNTKHLKAAGGIGFISIIVRIGCIGLNMLSWKRERKPVRIGDHPSAPQDVRIRY